MHDVLGQVVVAIGDEDLLAEDAVAAILPPLGPASAGLRDRRPACGSVRFMVPIHSPLTSLAR